MMQVYAFSTPSSVRVPIALEELELPYELKAINVRKGEQKSPEYLAINPNGKVPVLYDPVGPAGKPLTLSESGAILIYLAEKTGKRLVEGRGPEVIPVGIAPVWWTVRGLCRLGNSRSWLEHADSPFRSRWGAISEA